MPNNTIVSRALACMLGAASGAFLALAGYAVAQQISIGGDLYPSHSGKFKLGDEARPWRSINESIWFDADGNVGIDDSLPLQRISLAKAMRIGTAGNGIAYTCNSNARGSFWVREHANATDTLDVCIRDENGAYAWTAVQTP